jgi:hypothetical protein
MNELSFYEGYLEGKRRQEEIAKLAQGSYQAEAKKFKDVKVGQAFRFSSENKFPYSGMARGPWIKTSNSHYRHADEDHHRERYGDKDLKVGSHHAEVE